MDSEGGPGRALIMKTVRSSTVIQYTGQWGMKSMDGCNQYFYTIKRRGGRML